MIKYNLLLLLSLISIILIIGQINYGQGQDNEVANEVSNEWDNLFGSGEGHQDQNDQDEQGSGVNETDVDITNDIDEILIKLWEEKRKKNRNHDSEEHDDHDDHDSKEDYDHNNEEHENCCERCDCHEEMREDDDYEFEENAKWGFWYIVGSTEDEDLKCIVLQVRNDKYHVQKSTRFAQHVRAKFHSIEKYIFKKAHIGFDIFHLSEGRHRDEHAIVLAAKYDRDHGYLLIHVCDKKSNHEYAWILSRTPDLANKYSRLYDKLAKLLHWYRPHLDLHRIKHDQTCKYNLYKSETFNMQMQTQQNQTKQQLYQILTNELKYRNFTASDYLNVYYSFI